MYFANNDWCINTGNLNDRFPIYFRPNEKMMIYDELPALSERLWRTCYMEIIIVLCRPKESYTFKSHIIVMLWQLMHNNV